MRDNVYPVIATFYASDPTPIDCGEQIERFLGNRGFDLGRQDKGEPMCLNFEGRLPWGQPETLIGAAVQRKFTWVKRFRFERDEERLDGEHLANWKGKWARVLDVVWSGNYDIFYPDCYDPRPEVITWLNDTFEEDEENWGLYISTWTVDVLGDQEVYFGFKNQDDAFLFTMRWK
jgi:hypothetical protein